MNKIIRSPNQLGSLIRSSRKKSGLTQGDLADKTGLWQETISKIETGNKATKIETILKVIAMLDLDLSISDRQRTNIEDIL
jgi:HTH-type transcriptional regulator/antitoxin HipB